MNLAFDVLIGSKYVQLGNPDQQMLVLPCAQKGKGPTWAPGNPTSRKLEGEGNANACYGSVQLDNQPVGR